MSICIVRFLLNASTIQNTGTSRILCTLYMGTYFPQVSIFARNYCIFDHPFPGEMPASNKVKKGGSLKTLDAKPGVYTRYKPYLSKDKQILKRLAKVWMEMLYTHCPIS